MIEEAIYQVLYAADFIAENGHYWLGPLDLATEAPLDAVRSAVLLRGWAQGDVDDTAQTKPGIQGIDALMDAFPSFSAGQLLIGNDKRKFSLLTNGKAVEIFTGARRKFTEPGRIIGRALYQHNHRAKAVWAYRKRIK
jgi:hypothetical protein